MKYEQILIQGKNYLRISGEINAPGYMLGILRNHKFDEMVGFRIFEGSEGKYLLYETDAFITLDKYLSENGLDAGTFRTIVEKINIVFNVCMEYLLDTERIVLDPGLVFIRPGNHGIRFIYSLMEARDTRKTTRNFLSRILGNYFSGFTIDDERFREWAVREIGRKDFSIGRLLSCWYSRNTRSEDEMKVMEPEDDRQNIIPSIKRIWNKFQVLPGKEEKDETVPVTTKDSGLFLNGLCSIGTRIPLNEEGITIGRQMLKQDYRLSNGRIGRSHARIYMVGDEVYITDLGSRNGTYLNGERIGKQAAERIERGDIVSFSDEEFILC